jgi:hypothetical protein
MMRTRHLAIAFSLANLCFLAYWFGVPGNSYLLQQPATADNLAVIADVLLLGLAFWAFYSLARLSQRQLVLKTARFAFLLVVLIPLNAVRRELPFVSTYDLQKHVTKTELIFACAILGTVFAYVVVRWSCRIIPALAFLVLLLFPFTFFTFGGVLAQWLEDKRAVWSDTPPAIVHSQHGPPTGRRVLWIVFDGMDERLTFIDRPPGLKLPEIDRLRDEALWASNAFPPAEKTLSSMPSLINGRIVARAKPQGTSDLLLTYEGDDRTVNWRNTANVFSEAQDLGYKTAIVGWDQPYGRVIGSSVDFCQWFPSRDTHPDLRFFPRMLKLLLEGPGHPRVNSLWQDHPIGLFARGSETLDRIKMYQAFCQLAIPLATNRDLGLILLHWPIPHPPGIYSKSRGDFDGSGRGNYIDNLALVDRTTGELRQAMVTAGVWDSTTVLVSADHWYRTSLWLDGKIDHRVPFLVKLAGQTTRRDYHRSFNTVVTHDLILSVLRGELRDPESVARWLDQRNDPNPFAVFDPASAQPRMKDDTALVLKNRRPNVTHSHRG